MTMALDDAIQQRDELLASAQEVERLLKFAFEDGALDERTILGLCVDPYGLLADLRTVIARAEAK